MVHAEMCNNWKYELLHQTIQKRAIVSDMNKIHIGFEVPKMHQNDHAAEEEGIRGYNEGIRLAVEVADNGTRELLESILKVEEAHTDWIEAQLEQINQVGLQNYLAEQIY